MEENKIIAKSDVTPSFVYRDGMTADKEYVEWLGYAHIVTHQQTGAELTIPFFQRAVEEFEQQASGLSPKAEIRQRAVDELGEFGSQ